MLTFTVCSSTLANDISIDVSSEMRAVAEDALQFHISDDIKRTVNDLVNHINSDDHKLKVQENREIISKSLGVSPSKQNYSGESPVGITGSRAYLFISETVTLDKLRKYVRDAVKLNNIVLVLRGFKGGGKEIKPTLRFISDVLRVDLDCKHPSCPLHTVSVEIDPLRFNKYGINRVPALVYEPNENFYGYCDDKTKTEYVDRFVVYGDSSLLYALEQIHKRLPDSGLSNMISLLTPKPWENR